MDEVETPSFQESLFFEAVTKAAHGGEIEELVVGGVHEAPMLYLAELHRQGRVHLAVDGELHELQQRTRANELILTTNVWDHAARLRSYELIVS